MVAMEFWQARALSGLTTKGDKQVTLLGLWALTPKAHIEDPFGLSEAYFDECFSIIDESVSCLVSRLKPGTEEGSLHDSDY